MLTNVLPPQVEIRSDESGGALHHGRIWLSKPHSGKSAIVEKDLDKYTGRYDFTNGAVMLISKEKMDFMRSCRASRSFRYFHRRRASTSGRLWMQKLNLLSDAAG